MFRPLTIIAITAFSVVGWNVYRAEDSARQLDREYRDLARRIEQARDRTQVLRAEWALLNEPERLRQVAQKYLPLDTMTPAQFIRLGDLDRRLPTAMAFAGPVNLFAQAPAPEAAVAEARPTAPGKPGAASTAVAAAEAPEPAVAQSPVRVAARAVIVPAPRPEHPQPARAEPTRAEPAHAEPARVAVAKAEEPRRRPAPLPAPRAETVALREAPREVVREAPRDRVVAETPRPGLLRQAIHLPISSANAAPLPQAGTGGIISVPVSAAAGSALGMASRGSLAAPVPLPLPVPVR